MNFKFALSTGVSALLITASTTFAWNAHGHMLSAYIAYQDLKHEQRTQLSAILKKHPQYDQLAKGCPKTFDQDTFVFMKAAVWPDMVRSERNALHATDHHSKWHYINFPINLGSARGPKPDTTWDRRSDPANILQALEKCRADLKSTGLAEDKKAIALCWYLHLIGDIHQPLHASALFSTDYPQGDQGGNLFWVEVGGKPTKLHAYWDDVLGETDASTKIVAQAKDLQEVQQLTRAKLSKTLHHHGFEAWARESEKLAKTDAYRDGHLQGAKGKDKNAPPDKAPALPADYNARSVKIAEERIALAGYRIADELASLGK